MIFSSLKETLKVMVSKPYVFIPMLIVVLAIYVLSNLTSWTLERPLGDIMLYGSELGQTDLAWTMINNYFPEILTMFLSGFVILVIGIIGILSLASMAKGDGFVESINSAVKDWKKAFALAIFILLVATVLAVIFFIVATPLMLVPATASGIALIFDAFFMLVGALNSVPVPFLNEILPLIPIAFILSIPVAKFIFTLPALEKSTPKKAFQDNWEFTIGKYWKSVIFLTITFCIYFYVSMKFIQLVFLFSDLEVLITIIGDVIIATFLWLAVSFYYHSE